MSAIPRPSWRDLAAGLTVALVLVPQSMAYADLAGLPAKHGLYAAAAAPILAAVASSSPYLQTGPVALTSLLVLGALSPVGQAGADTVAEHAALLALVVGGTRVLIGALRLGFVAYLMSQPVVAAFTLSAALLIACGQVPALLGTSATAQNPFVAAAESMSTPQDWIASALLIGVASLSVTLGTRRFGPMVPGAFLAALVALMLSAGGLVSVPVVGDIPNGLPTPNLDLPWGALPSLVVPGVVIALVGFAEAASISRQYASADRMAWSPNQEFVGQGLANLAAGTFAGYPVGGSFSRSALNRLSGARTRWSGMVTGLAVLSVLPFASVLSELPRAAMAGLVIASVIPLLNPIPVTRSWRLSRPQFGVALITFSVSVAAAPQVQWGVVAGVAAALAVHLWRELGLHLVVWVEDPGSPVAGSTTLHVRPEGVLYFGSAPSLETRILMELAAQPELGGVRIHLEHLGRIDLTGALVLRAICRDLTRAHTPVSLTGGQPSHRRLLDAVFAGDSVNFSNTDSPLDSSPPRPVLVRDVMVRRPKVLPATATVGEVRTVFASDHVHMVLLAHEGRLVTAVDRDEVPDQLADELPAGSLGRRDGRVIAPDALLEDARELLDSSGRRRLAVVDAEGQLEGLLCLKRTRAGFCSDLDVEARARERAALAAPDEGGLVVSPPGHAVRPCRPALTPPGRGRAPVQPACLPHQRDEGQ